MRKTAVICVISLLFVAKLALAQAPEDRARFAAEQWIVLVDDHQYDQSWKEASKVFQELMTTEQWQKKASADREQLGEKHSRKLVDIKTPRTVKGLPAGQYVQVKYQSSFENKKSATETVTAVLEGDGSWRVAAYTIN